MLSANEEVLLSELFEKKHGVPLQHANISANLWTVATWKKDEVPYLRPENPSLINELDSIWKELSNTDRNTSVLPISASIINGTRKYEKILDYDNPVNEFEKKFNILTNNGMNDMAKNRTSESSNATVGIAVGDSAQAETIADSALISEKGRKAWSEKVTVNQTERYAGSFVRSDFGANVTLREAGGVTNIVSGGVLVFRVTFADKSISSGQIFTAQVAITHVNGTVV